MDYPIGQCSLNLVRLLTAAFLVSLPQDQMHGRETQVQALCDHESRMRLHPAPERSIENVCPVSLGNYVCIADISSVTEQCHQLTNFLTQLRDRVSTEDGERIADILEDVSCVPKDLMHKMQKGKTRTLTWVRWMRTCQNIGVPRPRSPRNQTSTVMVPKAAER